MVIAGRRRELDAVEVLLRRAADGLGGVLVLAGPPGSGRTALADAAAERARCRGFQVLRVAAAGGGPGGRVWTRLLRETGAPDQLIARMLAEPGPMDLDAAAVALCAGPPRLVLVDDVDRGGAETTELLTVLAGRVAAGPVAVVATSGVPLGVGSELWLGALSPEEIGAATGEDRPDVRHALWAASRGLPGPARSLAAVLAGQPPGGDPVVQLALCAESAEGFLTVDTGLVILTETALQRAADDRTRARLLARLAHGLLGDASATGRRRALVQEAVVLARRSADPAVLAEVLDARLHALWDPEGASDRLETAAQIIELARASADLARERRGLFWRFVALMELGRVAEAEAALAAFEREARAAGDAQALVMVTSRHAVLAALRGRFGEAHDLIEQVSQEGQKVGLARAALAGRGRGPGRCSHRHRQCRGRCGPV